MPFDQKMKVLRGGAWDSKLKDFQISTRFVEDPETRHETIGFRCAKSKL